MASLRAATAAWRLARRVAGLAARARSIDAIEVLSPQPIAIQPEFVEVIPGIDAGVVAVGKLRLDRIAADRLDTDDLNVLFADLQDFLPRAVTAHLCGRAIDPQQLVRQLVPCAV